MSYLSPVRLENISSSILASNNKSRHKTNKALQYVLECKENEEARNLYTEQELGVSLLTKCRAVVELLPNTAKALVCNKSPVTFVEAYRTAITMKQTLQTKH